MTQEKLAQLIRIRRKTKTAKQRVTDTNDFPNDITLKDRFSFDPLPDAFGFRAYWYNFKEQLLDKTKDQDACTTWLEEIENSTWEQLDDM